MIGRLHVRTKIRKRLLRQVASIAIPLREVDVIGYLRTKLKENPSAVGTNLEADTLGKIPEDISEMYVEARVLGKLPQVNRCTSRFSLASLDIFRGP